MIKEIKNTLLTELCDSTYRSICYLVGAIVLLLICIIMLGAMDNPYIIKNETQLIEVQTMKMKLDILEQNYNEYHKTAEIIANLCGIKEY